MPKVSVILPTCNRPSLLSKAIKSVLNQSYQDFEIIVVDDGLLERAEDVVKKINDERIKYIKHEKNLGGGVARNTGIKNARGEFVAFLDDDDEWVENKLDLQIQRLKNSSHDIGFCFSAVKNIYDDKEVVSVVEDGIIDYYEKSLSIFKGVLTVTMVVKKYVFEDVGYFDETLPSHQEAELVIRMSKKFKGIGINEPLANVLVLSNHNQMGKNINRRIKGRELVLNKHLDEIKKYPDKLARHYFWLGLMYRDNNQYDKARSSFKNAIKINFKPLYFLHYMNILRILFFGINRKINN